MYTCAYNGSIQRCNMAPQGALLYLHMPPIGYRRLVGFHIDYNNSTLNITLYVAIRIFIGIRSHREPLQWSEHSKQLLALACRPREPVVHGEIHHDQSFFLPTSAILEELGDPHTYEIVGIIPLKLVGSVVLVFYVYGQPTLYTHRSSQGHTILPYTSNFIWRHTEHFLLDSYRCHVPSDGIICRYSPLEAMPPNTSITWCYMEAPHNSTQRAYSIHVCLLYRPPV